MRPVRLATLLLLLLLLLTTACSSAEPVTAPSTPVPTPTTIRPVAMAQRCPEQSDGPRSGTARAIRSTSGEHLYAVEAGLGRRGIVLVHGSGSRGLCNWWRELGWLPAAGYLVVAYDQACVGESSCHSDQRPVDDLVSVVADLRRPSPS
jgi:pimeloyl-ACP methyl ester carboxylesterase